MTESIDNLENGIKFDVRNQKLKSRNIFFKLFFATSVIILLCFTFLYFQILELNQPSENFPSGQRVSIQAGIDVKSITEILESNDVVRSKHLLYYVIVFLYDPTTIKASNYVFTEPLTTLEVARLLAVGDFNSDLVRVTHIEGERFTKLAIRASGLLPEFNSDRFIEIAEEQKLEGKLFPETYFIPPTFDEVDLLNLLKRTFEEQIFELSSQIENHPLTLDEILVLASIIEREANTPESMKLVSSVLQNRLEIGMALQADASIEYILDKPLSELTPNDLKIDSPYNTYLYPGLPPTPIGNPGLDSIKAVLEPTPSDYFYYITGNDGRFHFAETYNEHLINIESYLR